MNDPTSLPEANPGGATYTAQDLARLLQCSVRHVRNLDERRAIPGRLTFGRLVRFSKQQVDLWLAGTASCP